VEEDIARILAAGAEARRGRMDDDTKIHAAAAEAGVRDDPDVHRSIRRAAGLSDEDDTMAKAMADLDTAVAALGRPLKRHRLAATVATSQRQAPRPMASPPPPPRRPAPPPAPARVAPPPSLIALPPMPIVGPSRAEHDDGHHVGPVLGRYAFRDRLAIDLRSKCVSASPEAIVKRAIDDYGLGIADAAELAEWFMGHLQRDVERRAAR
jgi:hypothetical protein